MTGGEVGDLFPITCSLLPVLAECFTMYKRIAPAFFLFLETVGAGGWVGAIVAFGFAVAGTLFRTLPSITLAGSVNAQILHRLNLLETVAATLMALAALYFLLQPAERTPIRLGKTVLVLLMGSALFCYGTILTDRLEYLRTVEIRDFDHFDVAKQAFRDEFNRLHTLYTRLVGVNLLLGLGFLLLSAFERNRPYSSLK